MRRKDYNQERKDPRWQKMRLDVMNRDGFQCTQCGNKDETLNVHHAYYVKDRPCWVYPLWSLSTLCESCHSAGHEDDEKSIEQWEEMVGFIFGENLTQCEQDQMWDVSVEFARLRRLVGFDHFVSWAVFAARDYRLSREAAKQEPQA